MSLADKIDQIDRLQETIKAYGPFPADLLKKINYKFRLEWNYHSNSMEGNSLTKSETRSVMVGNITVGGKPIKDILEMKGHDEVISNILKIGKGELNLSESRIKDIHQGIMHEEDPEKRGFIGKWKSDLNYLYNYKNERFDFASPGDVPDRMHQLINWLNTEKEKIQRGAKDALHPVHLAFQFHLEYINIHPFYDGNGRTVRIFTNLILVSYGYPPLYVKDIEKGLYYQYLGDIQGYGGEPDLFYDFMAGLLIRSQELVLNALQGKGVEELDDLDKRIALLSKKMNAKESSSVKKTSELINSLLLNSIHPLLDRLHESLKKLLVFYDHLAYDFRINGDLNYNDDYDQFKQSSLIVDKAPNKGLSSLQIQFLFKGFKPKMESGFGTMGKLEFLFEDYRYGFKMGQTEVKFWPYSHVLDDEEMNQIILQVGNEVLEDIEHKIEQISKTSND